MTEATSAYAINGSATCHEIEVTLFTFVMVDRYARISGLVRVGGRREIRLSSIPEISVTDVDGGTLTSLSSHALPHGDMAWLSWLFERPGTVAASYRAIVERVDLVSAQNGRPVDHRDGPWVIPFALPTPG